VTVAGSATTAQLGDECSHCMMHHTLRDADEKASNGHDMLLCNFMSLMRTMKFRLSEAPMAMNCRGVTCNSKCVKASRHVSWQDTQTASFMP
jgi:hypothetical protein